MEVTGDVAASLVEGLAGVLLVSLEFVGVDHVVDEANDAVLKTGELLSLWLHVEGESLITLDLAE